MNKGELTKKKIIEAATLLFYDKGLNDIPFAQIAAKASLTQPAIYKYFENKTVLLAHCCTSAAEEGRKYIRSKINPMDLPQEQIKSYISANLEWFNKNRPEAYALISMYYFAHSSEIMSDLKNQIEQSGIKNITILVRQSYGTKKFDLEKIQHTARLIHSMMVGEIFKMFYNQPVLSMKKRIETLEHQVIKILDSIQLSRK